MRRYRIPHDRFVRCQRCGHTVERSRLSAPAYRRQSIAGIGHLAPGDCEPAEYVCVCPDCEAISSFDSAVRCAECLERPCICIG